MITRQEAAAAHRRAEEYLQRANIAMTPDELKNREIADFGLSDLNNIGLEVIVYVNEARYCAKELVMFPRQICPEHRHPPVAGEPGKQETFRCRWGEVYIYMQGKPTPNPKAVVPERHRKNMTVWHEVILKSGEQFTIPPNTWHWFQSGDQGAIVSEFSSVSRDEADEFRDPEIGRFTVLKD
ncbi:MAG: D-lyxose/D-mannose family sugar isomerase [Anaerolineae bacterium]|nr:D-lyxose/D-mannose family sugar isomerase [Anaerolineae bacterium]